MVSRIITSCILLSTAILFSACSGGGGGTTTTQTTTTPTTTNLSGTVIDDYLQNAVVCIDINMNGNCDTDEPTANTGTQGEYTISDVKTDVATQYPLLAVATPGLTLDSGIAISGKYKLKSPAGKTIITPLTTMAQYAIENNPAIDAETAASTIVKAIGLTGEADADIYADYINASNTASVATKNKLHGVAKVVARTIGNNLTSIETAATAASESNVDNETLRIGLQYVYSKLGDIAQNVYSEVVTNTTVSNSAADTLATSSGGTYSISNFTRDLERQKAVSQLDKSTSVESILTEGVGGPDSSAGYEVDFNSIDVNNKSVDGHYVLNVNNVDWDGPVRESVRFKLDSSDNWVEIDEVNNAAHRTTQTWTFNSDGTALLTQVNPNDTSLIIDKTKVSASVVNLQGRKMVDFLDSWSTAYGTGPCSANTTNVFADANSKAIRWTWVTQLGGYMLQPESTYGTPTLQNPGNSNAPFSNVDSMITGNLILLVHNNQYLRLNNDTDKTVQFYDSDNTGTTVVATSNWKKIIKGTIEILIIRKPLAVTNVLPISDTTHLLFSVDTVSTNVSFGGHTPTGTAEVVDWWDFNQTAVNEYLTGCGFNALTF